MNKTIGLIGSGNMGGAIIGGMIKSGLVTPDRIIAADISTASLDMLREQYGIQVTTDNTVASLQSDILFLAVKPNTYAKVISQIRGHLKEGCIIITIAAGQKLSAIEKQFGRPVKVIRTMPNTPALVGEGMTALCSNALVSKEEMEEAASIFNSFGRAEIVDESLMDVVTSISGSSPAWVYMFIEAMSDAAVLEGMPRAMSYRLASQAVLGAAKMVLETGRHPGLLKDSVCSPGGTAIAGVCELENQGLRPTIISAVMACTEKSRLMGRESEQA